MRAGVGWRHPHYGELLQRQPAIGFLEVHSENFFADGGATLGVLHAARAHYPVSLHGVGLSLGSAGGVDRWHLERLQRLVERIDPMLVSDHACFARGPIAAHSGDMVHACDLLPVPWSEEALACMVANVQQVQDCIKRPIALENLSAYVHWQGNTLEEAEFLNAVAQRSGCGLLIDLNNIYVNALNDRIRGDSGVSGDALQQCRDWIDAIDPGAVAELHLAGHADCGDIVIDDHGSRVAAPVWLLYRHALARFGTVPTLIEWDTDIPALDVLLDEAARASQATSQVCHE